MKPGTPPNRFLKLPRWIQFGIIFVIGIGFFFSLEFILSLMLNSKMENPSKPFWKTSLEDAHFNKLNIGILSQ